MRTHHFPIAAVLYPARFISCAIVVSLKGNPYGDVGRMTPSCSPVWIGYLPLMSADLVGLQMC